MKVKWLGVRGIGQKWKREFNEKLRELYVEIGKQ
jgi:hypothetical protein